jgi:hypothetical protein
MCGHETDGAGVPMHDGAMLTGGTIPPHVPGAYPRLSCCGGPVALVPASRVDELDELLLMAALSVDDLAALIARAATIGAAGATADGRYRAALYFERAAEAMRLMEPYA